MGSFKLQQAPAAAGWALPPSARLLLLRFSHCTACYLPRLGLPPKPSAQTCCLTSPSGSLLLELSLIPFCTKSASASLPTSCLQPCAVMDRQGTPRQTPLFTPGCLQVVIWALTL